jgi:hypothetical protein
MHGELTIDGRAFVVTRATISATFSMGRGNCWLRVETEGQPVGDMYWTPELTHDGLVFGAMGWWDLSDAVIKWGKVYAADYTHPEVGILSVISQEPVNDSTIVFGQMSDEHIAVSWRGRAGITGKEPDGVPFNLRATMAIER